MQDVEIHGLDQLSKALGEIVRKAPDMQRAVHEKLGDSLHTVVQGNVRSHLNDSHGKISGWQKKYVGSRGGYAAVRATDSSSGPNSPGAITNYLENGHAMRKNKLHSTRQSRRMRQLRNQSSGNWVRGRRFYSASRADAPRLLLAAANDLADQIANTLR